MPGAVSGRATDRPTATAAYRYRKNKMGDEFESISTKLLDFEINGITIEQKAVISHALERLRNDAVAKRDAILMVKVQRMQARLNALVPKESNSGSTPPKLRELIEQYFNDDELKNLCFDLHIDYDNLPGETKSAKCRELISHCQRRGSTSDLTTELKRQRKNVSWDEADI